jgi:hypothetical protein
MEKEHSWPEKETRSVQRVYWDEEGSLACLISNWGRDSTEATSMVEEE